MADTQGAIEFASDERPIFEHIEEALACWRGDGEDKPNGTPFYIYLVNWLGLDPDVPLYVFKLQVAAGERVKPWRG